MNETRQTLLQGIIDTLNQQCGIIDAEMQDERNADAYSEMEMAADLLDSVMIHLRNAIKGKRQC